MSQLPCTFGRQQALALASMNLRAVLTSEEVRYLARPVPGHAYSAARGPVPARFQPRDEAGRFVTYAALRAAIGLDYYVTDFDCALEESGGDVEEYLDGCVDGDGDYVYEDYLGEHDLEDPAGILRALKDWLGD